MATLRIIGATHKRGGKGGTNPTGKLSQAERDALPASAFADPKHRKFLLIDKGHTQAAFARIVQARNEGRISAAEYKQIFHRAAVAWAKFKQQPAAARTAHGATMAKRKRAHARKGKRNPSGIESTLPVGMRDELAAKAKAERLALIKERAKASRAAKKAKAAEAKANAEKAKASKTVKVAKAKAAKVTKAAKAKAAKVVKSAKKVAAKVKRAPKSAPATQAKEPTMAKARKRTRKGRKGTRSAAQKAALKRMQEARAGKKPAKRGAAKRRTTKRTVSAVTKAPRRGKRRGRRAGPAVTATVTGTIGKKKRHTYVGSGRVRTYLVNPVGNKSRLILAVVMVPLGYLATSALDRFLATRGSLNTSDSTGATPITGANAYRNFARPDGTRVGAAAGVAAGFGIITALVHKKHPLMTAIFGGLALGGGVKFMALGGEFLAHKLQLASANRTSTDLMYRLFPEVYDDSLFADPLPTATYGAPQGLPAARRPMVFGPVGAVAGVTNRPKANGAVGSPKAPLTVVRTASPQPKDEREAIIAKVCASEGAQSAK